MARGVAGSPDGLPTREARYGLPGFQGGDPRSQVDSAGGEESGNASEESRRAQIERRIVGLTGEVGEFQGVGIDGDAPGIGQRGGRSGVIEMAVREQDGAGAAAAAEAAF